MALRVHIAALLVVLSFQSQAQIDRELAELRALPFVHSYEFFCEDNQIVINKNAEIQCRYSEPDGTPGIFLMSMDYLEEDGRVVFYCDDTDPPSQKRTFKGVGGVLYLNHLYGGKDDVTMFGWLDGKQKRWQGEIMFEVDYKKPALTGSAVDYYRGKI